MELVLLPLSVLAWTFAKLPALFIVAKEGRLVTGWVEAAEEEEEVYEVCIKGKTYYTSNEKSGVIYGIDSNGDVSLEVGVYKDGKPIFN